MSDLVGYFIINMKKQVLLFISLLSFLFTAAQVVDKSYNSWKVMLERKDGKLVPFILKRKMDKGRTVLYIINANERILITTVKIAGDSMFFSMPAFESSFRVKFQPNGDLVGTYIKGTSGNTQYWPLQNWKAMPKIIFPESGT
jgi:hypothetical protein